MLPPIAQRFVAVLITLTLAHPLCANVGPPSWGGHTVGEPIGTIDIAIARETLNIDLRPLAENKTAVVEAIYQLQNGEKQQMLDLMFVSGMNSVDGFEVWLDDQLIPHQRSEKTEVPESWKPPGTTPAIDGQRDPGFLEFTTQPTVNIQFAITVPPGEHELRVKYNAETAVHYHGNPTVYRQFAYVLAPAKAWKSFGGLDVKIELPTDWRFACSADMTREGDTLRASFDQLPGDTIGLTVQAPPGWAFRPLVYGGLALMGLVLIIGLVLCLYKGRSIGRSAAQENKSLVTCLFPAFIFSLAWAVVIGFAGAFTIFVPAMTLPEGQATQYGYGQAFAMIGVAILTVCVFLLGIFLALISALFAKTSAAAESRTAKN